MTAASFSPRLFAFLRELAANNDRVWFGANKARYEADVKEPALEFISAFAPRLDRISPHFVADARASGGSLYRIYRDTRFSKDKTPYKTHAGIHFRHALGRDAHAPGFYLHLEPGQVFAGAGIWRPDTAAARRIREAIAADPARWKRATRGKRFTATWELGGDALKRPPQGFAADHPLIDDLKRKDFIAMAKLRQSDVTAAGFVDDYAKLCAGAAPLAEFLCDALDVRF
jgi:uncharacterized protein (TIGR02453 family)